MLEPVPKKAVPTYNSDLMCPLILAHYHGSVKFIKINKEFACDCVSSADPARNLLIFKLRQWFATTKKKI